MSAAAAPKKPRKRHVVDVGDVVLFKSHMDAQTGVIGEVMHVPSHKYVIVKGIGVRYESYHDALWVVYTAKPRGKTARGGRKKDHLLYIREVAFRRKDFAPKPVKAAKVLTNGDELLEHLRSDMKEKIVYRPNDADKEKTA